MDPFKVKFFQRDVIIVDVAIIFAITSAIEKFRKYCMIVVYMCVTRPFTVGYKNMAKSFIKFGKEK